MSVSNGQNANQTTFNNAFVSKTVNSTTVGQVSLANTDPSSGDSITNIQRELNALSSFTGKAVNVAEDTLPTWTYSGIGASGNDLFDRLDAVSSSYDPTTGHTHDGTAGNGGQISALDLGDFNTLVGKVQKLTYTDLTDVTGTSFDFSDLFNDASKLPSGSSSTLGVYAVGSVPQNVVRIRYKDRPVTDAQGFEIYGRFDVTGSGPYTWNIDFFINNPDDIGEVAADIGTLEADQFGVDLYFMEVFNASTVPTVPESLTNLIPFGGTGSGSGGSTFAGLYVEPGTSTPAENYSSIGKRFSFDPDADQDVRILCVVPDSYAVGSQIFLSFLWGANATSGDVKWTAFTELYRPGTSTYSVAADSDTATTTVTLVTTADLIRSTTLDVTDAAGNVDVTAVAAGDLLVVYLSRNGSDVADTATVAANMIASSVKIGV